MSDIKFTIITATLLRDSLMRTCDSINAQSYTNYEHLVVIDLPDDQITSHEQEIINKISKNPSRKIIHLNKRYKDFGNTPRNIAGRQSTGTYLMYLDDDDYHMNDTMQVIYNDLQQYGENLPGMGVFRCLRNGTEFTAFPPRLCHTVSCQWFHKKELKGQEVLWPTTDTTYYSDGNFLESVKKLTTPVLIKSDKQLVCVDVYSGGAK